MSEQDKRKHREKERPAEPRSPGEAMAREQRDIPGEGGLPRREDMHPGEHRPRDEDEEEGGK